MTFEVFLDTGGLFAALVKRDAAHIKARELLRDARVSGWRFITTDYVLDESATLFKARGQQSLCATVFDSTLSSQACTVVWTHANRFERARQFFLQHSDHDYSFTDCLSFIVMRELRLEKAFATDRHFAEAGFQPLLAL